MREQLMNAVMVGLVAVALLEAAWAATVGARAHSFRDTVSSITLGVGQQAINVFLSGSFLSAWVWLDALSPLQADTSSPLHWAAFIIACDFCYYAGHATAHRVNFNLAAHIVHHQAEDFNHVSALRQGWFAWMVMFPFFLPLALLGAPVEMFIIGQMGIMCVQFLSHNGLFRGSLGLLDRMMVTPANHRVHHGINGPYLGANCGGMFVVWDRVFGTFVEEDPNIPVQLGSGVASNFYDPFEANLDYLRRILFVARHRRGLGKATIWFQSPQVLAAELKELNYGQDQALLRTPVSSGERQLVGAALLCAIAALGWHRVGFQDHSLTVRLTSGAAVMAMMWIIGRLLSPRERVSSAVEAR